MRIDAGATLVQELPWRVYRCRNPKCGFSKRVGKIVGKGKLLGVCKIMIGTIECGRCHHLNEFSGDEGDGEIVLVGELSKYKVSGMERIARVR